MHCDCQHHLLLYGIFTRKQFRQRRVKFRHLGFRKKPKCPQINPKDRDLPCGKVMRRLQDRPVASKHKRALRILRDILRPGVARTAPAVFLPSQINLTPAVFKEGCNAVCHLHAPIFFAVCDNTKSFHILSPYQKYLPAIFS